MRIPDAMERKTLIGCGVVGGALCAAPGELVSALSLWTLTLLLFWAHLRLLRAEEPTPRRPPPPDVPTPDPRGGGGAEAGDAGGAGAGAGAGAGMA